MSSMEFCKFKMFSSEMLYFMFGFKRRPPASEALFSGSGFGNDPQTAGAARGDVPANSILVLLTPCFPGEVGWAGFCTS